MAVNTPTHKDRTGLLCRGRRSISARSTGTLAAFRPASRRPFRTCKDGSPFGKDILERPALVLSRSNRVLTLRRLVPLSAPLRRRELSITRTAEILALAGLLHDDRIPSFTSLAQPRLELLPEPMAADVRDWLRTRSQGAPRSRPRDEHTVRMNLNRVHPLLLDWAGRYSHLREVTAADVSAATGSLPGSLRRQTLIVLRSLFGHCKKTSTIFRDPTRGVRDGQRPLILIQLLRPADIDQAASAAVTPAARLAVTPAARLAVALAAVDAARPRTIRELHLGDIDLGNRRPIIAGRPRRSTT